MNAVAVTQETAFEQQRILLHRRNDHDFLLRVVMLETFQGLRKARIKVDPRRLFTYGQKTPFPQSGTYFSDNRRTFR